MRRRTSPLERLLETAWNGAHKDLTLVIEVKKGHAITKIRYKDKQIIPDHTCSVGIVDINEMAEGVLDALAERALEKPQPVDR